MTEQDPKSSDATEPHSPLNQSSLSWRQPLPAAMDLKLGAATYLDQYSHQLVAPLGVSNTIWQWAEPLRLIGIKLVDGQTSVTAQVADIPYKRAAGGGKRGNAWESVPGTPWHLQIKAEITKAFGEFSGNKFFSFPGTYDNRTMAIMVNAVDLAKNSDIDKSPLLRCVLLSEIVARPETIIRATQLPSRRAIDLAPSSCTRLVLALNDECPSGTIVAVDGTLFSRLISGERTFPGAEEMFKVRRWGDGVTVILSP